MKLDDLKQDWQLLVNQTEHQHQLTPEIINQMTKKKYAAIINRIKYSEWIGGITCILATCFIGFNFEKLNTVFFQVAGISAILLLISMVAISFISLKRFNLMPDINKPYAEILRQFAKQRVRFSKYQQVNAGLSYLLLVSIIILLPKFSSDKNISGNKYFWTFAFSFGYIYLMLALKWVKKFHGNTLTKAEEILNELGPE